MGHRPPVALSQCGVVWCVFCLARTVTDWSDRAVQDPRRTHPLPQTFHFRIGPRAESPQTSLRTGGADCDGRPSDGPFSAEQHRHTRSFRVGSHRGAAHARPAQQHLRVPRWRGRRRACQGRCQSERCVEEGQGGWKLVHTAGLGGLDERSGCDWRQGERDFEVVEGRGEVGNTNSTVQL